MWFDSAEAEAEFRWAIAESDSIRTYVGEPPAVVIDLRTA